MTPRRRATDTPLRRRVPIWVGGVIIVAALCVIVWTIASNTRASQDIYDERSRNTLTSCQESNARNRRTKSVVRKEFPQTADTRVVFLLIDALAPYRKDCSAYVRERVSPD